jgi:hypothetical protein
MLRFFFSWSFCPFHLGPNPRGEPPCVLGAAPVLVQAGGNGPVLRAHAETSHLCRKQNHVLFLARPARSWGPRSALQRVAAATLAAWHMPGPHFFAAGETWKSNDHGFTPPPPTWPPSCCVFVFGLHRHSLPPPPVFVFYTRNLSLHTHIWDILYTLPCVR